MAGIVARIPDANQDPDLRRPVTATSRNRCSPGRRHRRHQFRKVAPAHHLVHRRRGGVIAISKASGAFHAVSQARRGRRVYGGTRQFLPLKSIKRASCR